MDLWIEMAVSTAIALCGVLVGWACSRLGKPFWLLGCIVPMVVLLAIVLAYCWPVLLDDPPFSWIALGHRKWIIAGFAAVVLLTTPLPRLKRKRDRVLVCVLIALLIIQTSIWPSVAPLSHRAELSQLETSIDSDGICRQSNGYTCGAAATVTALRRLGIPAEESEIAILARTTWENGTQADVLAEQLRKRYGKEGLIAQFRFFRDIEELRAAGLSVTVIKLGQVDHMVAVLNVTDESVIVGDPAGGLATLSHDTFLRMWLRESVVLRRKREG